MSAENARLESMVKACSKTIIQHSTTLQNLESILAKLQWVHDRDADEQDFDSLLQLYLKVCCEKSLTRSDQATSSTGWASIITGFRERFVDDEIYLDSRPVSDSIDLSQFRAEMTKLISSAPDIDLSVDQLYLIHQMSYLRTAGDHTPLNSFKVRFEVLLRVISRPWTTFSPEKRLLVKHLGQQITSKLRSSHAAATVDHEAAKLKYGSALPACRLPPPPLPVFDWSHF